MPAYRSLTILIFILFLPGAVVSQGLDYEQIFGEDWKKAESWLSENRHWMVPVLEDHNIPSREAIAVVFPELVRYSALKDKIETTLLKALYVNLGDEYANFSIGSFQIKPSFASLIRTESYRYLNRRSGIRFLQPWHFNDISNYRKSIVVDLEDPKTQLMYIVAFFKVCDKKYRTGRMDDEERLKFMATAYNYGIDKNSEQISEMTERKFFTTRLFKSTTYCYSDISSYWYRKAKR